MTIESLLTQYESIIAEREALRGENQDLKDRTRHYETYIKTLEEGIRLLQHRGFAPTSEKLGADEQMIFDEIEVEAKNSPPEDDSEQLDLSADPKPPRKRGKRKLLPKDLPRETVTIELPEDERHCPHDGTELKVIGEERSERLDVIPAQAKVIETIRFTYACSCCERHVATAAVEPQIVPKGIPTSGTLAFIATAKFCDGLSLYHIEKMFERMGAEIGRGSMAHWMIRVHGMVQPLLNLLEEDLLLAEYLQIDETTVQVLKEKGKKAETKSYMWVRARPDAKRPIVLFDYDPTRGGAVAKGLLETFSGKLQCDGYSGYDGLGAEPRITRYGCLAHARRKFFEATKATKNASVAKHALKLIQKLYRIEDQIKGKPPDEVLAVRAKESVPLLNELKAWGDQHRHKVPPKSPTGKALLYLSNEWPYLSRFAEDGQVMIDNNFIENKIRPFAVGRKRWLFSDSVDEAKASAALYSLIETAKANGLEPYAYPLYIFDRLPRAQVLADFEELLPWNVKI
jgi:transposase